ncbi:hypothetical protein LCGC14_0209580 [marine sediment metagenome]|uniref:Uncharacterized protein n=1 Tax=marine sediment metagenome TaxID=412755 RepID=A0A0F9UY78_9ZZZZ
MTEPLITIGAFRLAWRNLNSIRAISIEHRCRGSCSRHKCGSDLEWHPFVYGLCYRGIPCFACREAPPEGIQAMFWFLKEGA